MILRKTFVPVALAASLAFGAALPAAAQAPTATATAEALFAEGRKLSAEGKFAEACPKFEGAQKVAPTPGTQLNLADCYEKVGRIASAWASFRDAVSMARSAGRADLVTTAQRRASALEARLPKLAITVTATAAGLEIMRDGVMIPKEAWTTAVPIDPGEHTVEAKAPGRKSLRLPVAAPAEGATATLNVPELEIDPDAAVAAKESATGGAPIGERPSGEAPASSGAWSTQKKIGAVVGGVGVVALAVGGIFAIVASGKNSDSNAPDKCDGNRCGPEGHSLREAALKNGNIATGFGVGGLVLAGTGAVLFFTAPVATNVAVGTGPGGLWLRGSFQ